MKYKMIGHLYTILFISMSRVLTIAFHGDEWIIIISPMMTYRDVRDEIYTIWPEAEDYGILIAHLTSGDGWKIGTNYLSSVIEDDVIKIEIV